MPDEWLIAAVTFASALLAVVLEHAVSVRRERRLQVERAAMEVEQNLATAVTGLSQSVDLRETQDMGSVWWQSRDAVHGALRIIRVQARWIRRGRQIRAEAADLAARLGAAQLRSMDGRPLPAREILNINSHALGDAVFGAGGNLSSTVQWYGAHGFSRRPPDENE